jgi:hypothetical protein
VCCKRGAIRASVPYQPFSLLENPCHFRPDIVLTAGEPVKLHFFFLLLLLLIFPDATRGFGKIQIPGHHYLVKGVGLNRKIPTRFGNMVVWDGNDSGDRILSARDGFTRKNVRVGVVECVAALAQEGQPEDTMIDVKFHSVGVDTNGEVLKTQKGYCDQPGHA